MAKTELDEWWELEADLEKLLDSSLEIGISLWHDASQARLHLFEMITNKVKAITPEDTRYRKTPISRQLRKAVLERDAYRCQECGDWHDLAIDHIIPESKGGPATLENFRALCKSCNSKKGSK